MIIMEEEEIVNGKDEELRKWMSKVKGTCAQCKGLIFNPQDTIALVDVDTNETVVVLHSNSICWRKWREENLGFEPRK